MLGFMEYVQREWGFATQWDRDNSYGALTATSRALLDFQTPVGLALSLSSLSSPSFANSYNLTNSGAVDGSISYLYSSLPLSIASKSKSVPLRNVIEGYRHLKDLRQPDEPQWWEIWHGGQRVDSKDTLLFGRMYLPQSLLEGLYMRRISPASQLKISCVSSSSLRDGGSMLFLLSRDFGKHSMEYLYSTDSGLFGIRGLYNFGPDPHPGSSALANGLPSDIELPAAVANGRFSAGAELYYGVLNKSGGMSMGCRFTTLPTHPGFPYTMTLTLNPLMGNLSTTYSVKAGPALALATRFDFNVYSYESQYQIGFELWRKGQSNVDLQWAFDKIQESEDRGWVNDTSLAAGKLFGGLEAEDAATKPDATATTPPVPSEIKDEDTAGVLKTRLNQDGVLGLLWEGRVKQLLYTFGVNMHLKEREDIFKGVGIEFHYSS